MSTKKQTWSEWWWGTKRQPMPAVDASHDPAIRSRFTQMLDGPDEPTWIKASEIAMSIPSDVLWSLGYETWEEVLPAVKELAFDMRAMGVCEICKKGRMIPEDVSAYEVEGGIRIRRKSDM